MCLYINVAYMPMGQSISVLLLLHVHEFSNGRTRVTLPDYFNTYLHPYANN